MLHQPVLGLDAGAASCLGRRCLSGCCPLHLCSGPTGASRCWTRGSPSVRRPLAPEIASPRTAGWRPARKFAGWPCAARGWGAGRARLGARRPWRRLAARCRPRLRRPWVRLPRQAAAHAISARDLTRSRDEISRDLTRSRHAISRDLGTRSHATSARVATRARVLRAESGARRGPRHTRRRAACAGWAAAGGRLDPTVRDPTVRDPGWAAAGGRLATRGAAAGLPLGCFPPLAPPPPRLPPRPARRKPWRMTLEDGSSRETRLPLLTIIVVRRAVAVAVAASACSGRAAAPLTLRAGLAQLTRQRAIGSCRDRDPLQARLHRRHLSAEGVDPVRRVAQELMLRPTASRG